ncbi:hypothetical protein M0802_012628 [Mischocyttarus mexicanus]|nr:hypothetical protein M0802_012628 [Mischocyttarus mexicanus]
MCGNAGARGGVIFVEGSTTRSSTRNVRAAVHQNQRYLWCGQGRTTPSQIRRRHLKGCHHHPVRRSCQIPRLFGNLVRSPLVGSHLILVHLPHPLPHHLLPLPLIKDYLILRLLITSHLISHLHHRLISHLLIPHLLGLGVLVRTPQKQSPHIESISDIGRTSHPSLSSCFLAPVLFETCKAFAISSKGVLTLIRLLLIDPGSELTLASAKLIAKLKLKRYPGSIPIQGESRTSPGATQGQITSQVPSSIISEQDWPHIRPLRLTDPDFFTPNLIDILIGADNLRRIMKSSRLIMWGDLDPIAFHTRFGWAVLGTTSSLHQSDSLISCHAILNESLNETLTKFWVQEEDSSCPTSSLSLAESECEKHFVNTYSRLPTL